VSRGTDVAIGAIDLRGSFAIAAFPVRMMLLDKPFVSHLDGGCIGARLETGTVYANRCDYLDPGLAWTGVKETGRGASLSRIGYEMLTRPKSFHLRKV